MIFSGNNIRKAEFVLFVTGMMFFIWLSPVSLHTVEAGDQSAFNLVLSMDQSPEHKPENIQKEKIKSEGPRTRGALHTGGGGVFDVGEFQVTIRHIYMKQDKLYEGSSRKSYSRPGPYKREANNFNLALRAGIFNNFDMRLAVPMSDRNMKRKTMADSIGQNHFYIGDIRLIGRYRLLSQAKGNAINLAAGAGIKMPTGETNKKKDGQSLPGFLQAGTGSWDPVFELAAHKVYGRYRVAANISYQMSTKGRRGGQDFEAPDDFRYNLAYVYALSNYFDAIFEINGRHTTKAKVDGEKQRNSGGHTIHLTPAINIKFTRALHFSLGVPVTAYRDLNGRQLSEDYRISSKMVYKF
jgi:hypothetical protein